LIFTEQDTEEASAIIGHHSLSVVWPNYLSSGCVENEGKVKVIDFKLEQ
jgi:hypothetical protein